jgi:hypothetical protein
VNTLVITSYLVTGAFDIFQTKEIPSIKNFTPMPLNSAANSADLLYYPIIGDSPFLNFVIIYRNDGASVAILQNAIGNLYFDFFRKKVSPIFSKTIKNLMNIRNHLLLQLDLECGNISEDYFDKEEQKYLSDAETISLEKLKEEVKLLFNFTNLPLDSEDISEMLNCPINEAEKALDYYISGV